MENWLVTLMEGNGLRQRDQVSYFLFVLVMDVLLRLLEKGSLGNVIRLQSSCQVRLLTHLSFVNDVLVFFDGSEDTLHDIHSNGGFQEGF